MKQNNYHLIDVFKLIGVILFIGVTTNVFASVNPTLNFIFVGILGRLFIPFVFISTSFNLFRSLDHIRSLDDKHNLNIVKRRLIRLARIYIIWTLIYLLPQMMNWFTKSFEFTTLLWYLRNFFFVGSYYHLWVFPALIFGTVFVYYLLTKFSVWSVFKIVIGLYIVGLLINVYQPFLKEIPGIRLVVSWYLAIFKTSVNGLFFAPIYILLGYYCATTNFNMNAMDVSKRLMISSVFLIIEAFFIHIIKYDTKSTVMYLSLVPFSFYLLLLLTKFQLKDHGKYLTFRSLTTLLYVSHVLFVLILNAIPVESYHSVIYFALTLVLSLYFSDIIYLVSKRFLPQFKILY